MITSLKSDFETNMIGCPSLCPSRGKFCEREIHTNEGKCQIRTGHQISSMGGKVWNVDKDNTAVLFMCDVYQEQTQIFSPNWGEFLIDVAKNGIGIFLIMGNTDPSNCLIEN